MPILDGTPGSTPAIGPHPGCDPAIDVDALAVNDTPARHAAATAAFNAEQRREWALTDEQRADELLRGAGYEPHLAGNDHVGILSR